MPGNRAAADRGDGRGGAGARPWLPLIGVVLGLELPPTLEAAQLGDAVRRRRLERTVSALLVRFLRAPCWSSWRTSTGWTRHPEAFCAKWQRGSAARAWVLCLTRRDDAAGVDPSGWPGALTMRLGSLEPASIEAFIQATNPGLHLARHELAAVTERAGGNPLFLRELLLHASATDPGE